MPTYGYRCQQCTHSFETDHGMKESPVVPCPLCGGLTERLTGSGVQWLKRVSDPSDENSEKAENIEPSEGEHHCDSGCVLHRPNNPWIK